MATVIHAALRVRVSSIACIVNDLDPAIGDYLRSHAWPVLLELITKTTDDCMEGLFFMSRS